MIKRMIKGHPTESDAKAGSLDLPVDLASTQSSQTFCLVVHLRRHPRSSRKAVGGSQTAGSSSVAWA